MIIYFIQFNIYMLASKSEIDTMNKTEKNQILPDYVKSLMEEIENRMKIIKDLEKNAKTDKDMQLLRIEETLNESRKEKLQKTIQSFLYTDSDLKFEPPKSISERKVLEREREYVPEPTPRSGRNEIMRYHQILNEKKNQDNEEQIGLIPRKSLQFVGGNNRKKQKFKKTKKRRFKKTKNRNLKKTKKQN